MPDDQTSLVIIMDCHMGAISPLKAGLKAVYNLDHGYVDLDKNGEIETLLSAG